MDYIDKGKILVSYSPLGFFPLDTSSEIFLSEFINKRKSIDLITKPGKTNDDGEWEFYPYGNYIWDGIIEKNGNFLKIKGNYVPTNKFYLDEGIEKVLPYKDREYHKCGYCEHKAVYLYMPSSCVNDFLYRDYFCEDCVPIEERRLYKEDISGKEVICEYKTSNGDILGGADLKKFIDNMTEDDYIYSKDKYPSFEYFYEKDGFEIEYISEIDL